jgi:hypothetical protein
MLSEFEYQRYWTLNNTVSEALELLFEFVLLKVSPGIGSCKLVPVCVFPLMLIPARQAFIVDVWYFAESVVPWNEVRVKKLATPKSSDQAPGLREFVSVACS